MKQVKSEFKENKVCQKYNSKSVLKLISDNDIYNDKITRLENNLGTINYRFKEMQDYNLECLVTKKYFNCLSCGSKKINYMPLNQFVVGDDGRAYKANPLSRDPKMFVNYSNVNAGVVFNPKYTAKVLKPSVFNVEFGNQQLQKENSNLSKYVSGQTVFTRAEAQKQHHAKRHLPLEEIKEIISETVINRHKQKSKISRKRKRPMTGIFKDQIN